MTRVVILSEAEWDALPTRLAEDLDRQMRAAGADWRLVGLPDYTPVEGQIRDWLRGMLAAAFEGLTRGEKTDA
jgi:hypothetical protein